MTWFDAHSTGVKTYMNSGQKFVAVEVICPRGGKYCYHFVRWTGYANHIAAYIIMFMLTD